MFSLFNRIFYLFFFLTTSCCCCLFTTQKLEASQTQQASKKTKICLTMIVKNESKIIERCLNHAKGVIDCISICDTGSTDNTKEIIENFMKENQIPGKVHEHSWKNFGHNRTLSAQAATQTLTELGFSLPETYLLLLDADMLLEVNPDFSKDHLSADSYLLMQENSDISYYNTRLIRASMPWECVGVTHEYWSCKTAKNDGKLDTLWIDDREDGGCKADKYERDVRLLTQGLKEDPNNERYMFYLAQSYKCMNQFEDAIRWYKARIQKGGWKEEVWFSKLMIGETYETMHFWDHALHWYLDAYDYHPNRAEPLQRIARHYRMNGENQLAYLFAKQGSRIPFPKDDVLFVSHAVYDYQCDEEISIAAYYTPYQEEGFEAADRLTLKENIPDNIKNQALKNLLFYVPNIKIRDLKRIEFELPLLREESKDYFYPMNPSIQKTAEGYDVICRTVNYGQKGGLEYKSRDPLDETIRTRNFLLHYDRDFKLLSQKEITENLDRKKHAWITGLEDCRLIGLDHNRWFLTTTYDTHPGTIGQSLCKFALSENDPFARVEKLLVLQGPDPKKCEKNWLPFMKGEELYILYGYDPFIVYQTNRENGDCKVITKYQPSHDFSRFRGSAAPIEFDDGYLLLVHEVIFNPDRYYLHRFVYLDKDFRITKLSRPFTFIHKGIEYCCGMTIDHAQKTCIIPIGHEDQNAYLMFVDLETIRSSLKPLP